jgi:alginate O-acetyltransferase complex protein AlgI
VFKKNLRTQNILLLCASYFFYGWWSYEFLALLILSTVLDFAYGFWVASPNRRKAKLFLWLSIINNLGILGVFKYYNFFAAQFQAAFESIGIHTNPIILQFALPVGISFYTFHGMSYVFDIYRGQQRPVKDFSEYAVFVSFFPLLVAGPIERAHHLLPQIQKIRAFQYSQAVSGCKLILWGMFKKIVIADSLSGIVNDIFLNYSHLNSLTLIIGAITFSFQIYCDFSGYSDIALGTAKLFGFELLSNFKFPYFSRDIAEFWRRWHISLSSWFRDYLYIPLGGSREGKYKAVRNTFIIFLVSGFWHGASWNFIIWGGIHAIGFLPLLLRNTNRKYSTEVVAFDRKLPKLRELVQIFATFAFVTFAWIFFRAQSLGEAASYIKRIASSLINDPSQIYQSPGGKSAIIFILPVIIGDWYFRRNERELKLSNKYLMLLMATITLIFLLSRIGENEQFIYFQF